MSQNQLPEIQYDEVTIKFISFYQGYSKGKEQGTQLLFKILLGIPLPHPPKTIFGVRMLF